MSCPNCGSDTIRYNGGYKGKACINLATCALGHYAADCGCKLHRQGFTLSAYLKDK